MTSPPERPTAVEASTGGDPLPDPARIVLPRRIEWIDTDAAGIYHWTTVFRLMEAAEAALHTALGIADRTFGALPRVSASVDFKRSVRFNDLVGVELAVDALTRSSVRYGLTLTCDDAVAVTGAVTAVFIDRSTGRAAPWPDDMRTALSAAGLQPAP